MLPLWAYGFGQTRKEYITELNEKNIPIEFDFTSEMTKKALLKRVDALAQIMEKGGGIPNGTEIQEDILGHLLLRAVCSQDEFETDWFVKREGYLFSRRFTRIRSFTEKFGIIKRFFGDAVKPVNEFLAEHDDTDSEFRSALELKARKTPELITIRWLYVPRIVSNRGCTLIDGWAIVGTDAAQSFLREWFEEDMRAKMEVLRNEFEKIDAVADLADEIDGLIREKSGMILGVDDVSGVVEKSPLCIVDLDRFITSGEDISYTETLQLCLYLKAVGLTMEDMKRYFYIRHPGNRNRTWEEYNRDRQWDYLFRHIYGLAGSHTDYSPYGCPKARDEGHCPFRGVNTRPLLKRFREQYTSLTPDQNRLEQLLTVIRVNAGKNPNRSCTAEFTLRFGFETRRTLTHPVKGYYRLARELGNKEEETEMKEVKEG